MALNKSFGKLNEENEIDYAPSPLVVDGENVWTNIPEVYLAQGYYRIVKTQPPVKDGYCYSARWEQDGETIVQRWDELPVAEKATESELQAAIREGVNSIDS